jgi:hypothetical protein
MQLNLAEARDGGFHLAAGKRALAQNAGAAIV